MLRLHVIISPFSSLISLPLSSLFSLFSRDGEKRSSKFKLGREIAGKPFPPLTCACTLARGVKRDKEKGRRKGADIILPLTRACMNVGGEEEGGEKFLPLTRVLEGKEERKKEFSPPHAHMHACERS